MKWLCRYHKFRMNHALDDACEPPGRTLKHLKSCACCQSWYQSQRRLISNLRNLAKSKDSIESPQLLPSVLASINKGSATPSHASEKTTPLPWQKWLMPFATTCVAITLILQWANPTAPVQSNDISAKWLALSPDGLVQQTTGQSIADWGQKLDQPLEKEWLLLKEDAQAAAGGLAGTFLPSKFMASYQHANVQQP